MTDISLPDAIALAAGFLAIGFYCGCAAISEGVANLGDQIRQGLGEIYLSVMILSPEEPGESDNDQPGSTDGK